MLAFGSGKVYTILRSPEGQKQTTKKGVNKMMQQELNHRAKRIARQFPYHVQRAMDPLMDFFPPICRGEFSLKLVRLVNDYRFYFGRGF